MRPTLLVILGPTACGKTVVASECAYRLGGEIISADSRQVFRGMDIGTGKDLKDYDVHGVHIPYHLIDICNPGEEYSAYRFQNDFIAAFNAIVSQSKVPILCGGTGLYIESVVRNYRLSDAPVSSEFRESIKDKSNEELTRRLASLIKLHNHTDTETRDRLVRALEIAEYQQQHPDEFPHMPPMRHAIVGIACPREELVERIGARLRLRLKSGMVEEVERLLKQGVSEERLLRYGLEYRHLTRYLTGKCTYAEMEEKLFTDIRRFSKRQMTWFRRMERNGVAIHWIDGTKSLDEKVETAISYCQKC
ncbi:MAG: tRNA (adenosine(37)-N6)-dimethylallyltransferase MiaA [Bacteroidales bacterium]|nr:tRNA (adenosine(37)-N6)-dimethylallyltransferase MiaA [Bacteroidales bacterium]